MSFNQSHKNYTDLFVDKPSNAVSASQFLFLSLFLILLAFFIAMTAGATFDDDRTNPILENLHKVFPVKELRNENLPTLIEGVRYGSNLGQALDTAEHIFTADSFPFSVKIQRQTGALSVELPIKDLKDLLDIEQSGHSILTQTQKQGFFANLATLTQPGNPSRRIFKMGINIFSQHHPSRMAGNNRSALNNLILEAERYALNFERKGISSTQMYTVIQKGNTETVRLIFTPVPLPEAR